jgi:hypothetical protein
VKIHYGFFTDDRKPQAMTMSVSSQRTARDECRAQDRTASV